MLENTDRAIKKENPEKLATFGTEDTRWRQKTTTNKQKTQHRMFWRPLYTNKHKTSAIFPYRFGMMKPRASIVRGPQTGVSYIFIVVIDLSYASCHKPGQKSNLF